MATSVLNLEDLSGGYSKGIIKEFTNVTYGTGADIVCEFTPKIVMTRVKSGSAYGSAIKSVDTGQDGGKWTTTSGASGITINGNTVHVDVYSAGWSTNTTQVAIMGD